MVIIHSLKQENQEALSYNYLSPVYAVELETGYAKKRERTFASGGIAGQLIVNKKGWIIQKDTTIHEGEGPVHCIKWSNFYLAWANDWGVKVYDAEREQRVTFVERPSNCPPVELCRCHLVWEDDSTLIIGWGDCIKIVKIQETTSNKEGNSIMSSTTRYGEVVAIFQMEFFISGLCIWDDKSFALLGYFPPEVDDDNENDNQLVGNTDGEGVDFGNSPHPELHIISREDGEDLAADALPLKAFDHLKASDYRLESTFGTHDTCVPPVMYILAPKDLVIARARDVDDHVAWELEAKNYERALEIARENPSQLRKHKMKDLVTFYLGFLFSEGRYSEAAALCPELLGESASLWEHWVWVFAQKGHLAAIAPYIPTSNPRISNSQYEMVLKYFLENDPKELLATLRKWPKPTIDHEIQKDKLLETQNGNEPLYSAEAWINRLENILRHRGNLAESATNADYLSEILAELYIATEQYEHALRIYLNKELATANKDNIFRLIAEHDLWKSVHDKALRLMILDKDQAVRLLVSEIENLPVASVVSQLAERKDLQLDYLHNLFARRKVDYNNEIYAEFHDLQVALYAELRPSALLSFLKGSNFVPLEKAHTYCTRQDPPLWEAMIYILQRMGNHKDALDLIVAQIKDVNAAIDFVQKNGDDELWDYLLDQSVDSPEFVCQLLDHASNRRIDPLKLISKIPSTMEIPGLKGKLIQIISDYKLQLSLCEGCNKVFAADSTELLCKLTSNRRKAIRIDQDHECKLCCEPLKSIEGSTSLQIAVFYCGHSYHAACVSSNPQLQEMFCYLCGYCGDVESIKIITAKKLSEARQLISQREKKALQ